MGGINCWRLCIEEAYPGPFLEYGISIAPGLYIFEDLGSPLCFVGQRSDRDGIMFTFPVRHSPIWAEQNVNDAGSPNTSMTPC
jgi:hypothetical protein